MLDYEAVNIKTNSTTTLSYGGGKQCIDEKIKAGFLAMPATITTIFEGFGGGFNIPYIYSTLEDINPDIEYIITETNKTVVNLMKWIRSERGLKALKREISKILADSNACIKKDLDNMAEGDNVKEVRKQATKKFFKARVEELNKLEEAKKYTVRAAALYYCTMNGCFVNGYKMVDGISSMHYGKDAISSQNIFAKLELFHKAFNKINLKIMNKSYLDVSAKMDKETTFAVFDSPYIADDESVKLGKKTYIYGLKSFDHQRCANEFKKYSSGMYFNNLNTPFRNANLDIGLIEEWAREGKQADANKNKRKVTEIFVRRDIANGMGEAFNTEGLSDGQLQLRAIVARIKESPKIRVNDKKTTKNPQQGVKIARKSVKNSKKDKKGARRTNKKLLPASQNNNQTPITLGNIKTISRVKKYSNKSDIANSGTLDNQTINSKIA